MSSQTSPDLSLAKVDSLVASLFWLPMNMLPWRYPEEKLTRTSSWSLWFSRFRIRARLTIPYMLYFIDTGHVHPELDASYAWVLEILLDTSVSDSLMETVRFQGYTGRDLFLQLKWLVANISFPRAIALWKRGDAIRLEKGSGESYDARFFQVSAIVNDLLEFSGGDIEKYAERHTKVLLDESWNGSVQVLILLVTVHVLQVLYSKVPPGFGFLKCYLLCIN